MKVLISESQILNIIESFRDLSVHLDRKNLTGLDISKKYYSDNIVHMDNRGTGHFGSGAYFSSYKSEDPEIFERILQSKELPSQSKPIVEVIGGAYMTDLSLYNLYKPQNKNHAELLFDTLKKINNLASIHDKTKINLSDFHTKKLILEISDNLKRLDLKAPSLKEFVKLFDSIREKYESGTLDHYGSLSTRFMEYNGYNGVNVNHIPGYDNTLHGSVIYDFEKTISNPTDKFNTYKDDLDSSMNPQFQFKNIIKSLENGVTPNELRFLPLEKLNLIFNLLKVYIPLNNFKYRLSEELYNHVYYVLYPAYIKRILNIAPNKIYYIRDEDSLIAVFMAKIPFQKIDDRDFTVTLLNNLSSIIYDIDESYLTSFKIKEYTSVVKQKYPEDEDIQMHIADIEPYL